MSKNSFLLVAAGAAALTLVSSSAATVPLNASPGLWQVSVQTQMNGQMPMDDSALKNLPPAQRAKFQAAMQAAMGNASKPRVFRECLTREKLAKGFDMDKPDPSCTRTIVTSSPNALEVREQCSSSEGLRSGDIKFALANSTTSMGSFHMRVTRGGKTMTIDGSMHGQWLSSDCGKVKNVEMVK